jgi:hypothetical protein
MNAPPRTASTGDPLRAEVERWLHTILTVGLAMPVAAVSSIRRCLGERMGPVADRVGEPVRVVRSLIELVAGAGPVGEGEASDAATIRTAGGDAPAPAAGSAAVPQLPIDEYESLAASHVVARLANLTPEELAAVRSFEVAHRGRRTIIGRIDHLLAAAEDAEATT